MGERDNRRITERRKSSMRMKSWFERDDESRKWLRRQRVKYMRPGN